MDMKKNTSDDKLKQMSQKDLDREESQKGAQPGKQVKGQGGKAADVVYFLTHSKSVGALAGKIILMLAIPYGYLFLCGLIFDYALKMPNMVYFIFFSMLALYVIAVVLIVYSIRNFRHRGRRKK